MKSKYVLTCLAAVLLSATSSFASTFVLADWTFETSQPGVVDLPAAPGAGIYITNIAPESGFGTASGFHAGASTYSSPAGNGSSHSFSSTTWAVGDYYQYVVNTSGASNITFSVDGVGSSTGPRDFGVSYSVDGITFTQFGTYANTSTITWSAGTSNAASTHFFDLSSVTALNNAPTVYFRATVLDTVAAQGGTNLILTGGTSRNDNVIVTGASTTPIPPVIANVTPASQTIGAGSPASFTVRLAGGTPTFGYVWYHGAILPGNIIAGATNATLTLPAVLSGDAGNYQVVVTNAAPTGATSSVVTLTVIDPAIVTQPANEIGLLSGRVSFSVVAGGGSLSYQWHYADLNSNLLGNVTNGTNTYSTSVNSGSTSSTLVISNLTLTDPTNFMVVVTDASGSVTSSVASIVAVSNTAPLAFWNFNGNSFSNNISSPPPYYGVGVASVVNCQAETAVVDGNDGADLAGFGLGGPPYLSWAAFNFPAPLSNSNKTAGVQFTTSTVGAQNIKVTYDSRATGTASEYTRLQFTTNGGTTWRDYPTSTTFGTPDGGTGIATNNQGQVGYAVSTYASFDGSQFPGYDLTGFANVDNNPNFGIRVVTEWQSTGTYGASPNTNYYGVANTYASGGTQSYDLVTISATAITNFSAPPLIASISDTNVQQLHTVTNTFTVTDTANPVNNLVITAVCPQLSLSSANFAISSTGNNRTMVITPQSGADGIAPVIVTATDPVSGLSSVNWFYLTVISINPAPTNSLLNFPGTNMLSSATLSLPFTATDDKPVGNLTYTAISSNNAVLPSSDITFNTNTAGSPIAIFNSTNALGAVPVTITVNDNDPQEPKTAPASFVVQVRPNTNVVLIDYFNYDNSGALFNVSAGLWTHLSGNAGTMQVGGANPGYVLVDQLSGNTENLQAKFSGSPYSTNSASVLYASFIANIFDPSSLPIVNGSYFAVFNDGSGVTGNYACRIMAATNGAAAGNYRLGVSNGGADATTATMFPMDLIPGNDYTVVVQLVVSNNQSSMWINPTGTNSQHVNDTNVVAAPFNISDFELRQSGGNSGKVGVARLKVGTTFDSVLPSLHIAVVGTNAVLTSSDPTLPVVSSANNVQGPFTNLTSGTPFTNSIGNAAQFYRFGTPTVPLGN